MEQSTPCQPAPEPESEPESDPEPKSEPDPEPPPAVSDHFWVLSLVFPEDSTQKLNLSTDPNDEAEPDLNQPQAASPPKVLKFANV